MKHGQITVFIILAIVLLVVAGSMLFLVRSAAEKNAATEAKKSKGTAFETEPIENYIMGCLDRVSKDAIEKLYSQGGYIYSS